MSEDIGHKLDAISGQLAVLISILAHREVSEEKIIGIVTKNRTETGKKKYLQAFNLFDGTRSLSDVEREVNVGIGNLSNTVENWIEEDILYLQRQERRKKFYHHIFKLESGE